MKNRMEEFIPYLCRLSKKDSGAISKLRLSLEYPLGHYPPAYPYVEPFVASDMHESNPVRLSLYLVGGLFAIHPSTSLRSLARSCGQLMTRREGRHIGIERRFISLLEAPQSSLKTHLRQIVTILAKENVGVDYTELLKDLCYWLDPSREEVHSQIQFRWMQEFYSGVSWEPVLMDSSARQEGMGTHYEPVC